jgi:hypothetical protein
MEAFDPEGLRNWLCGRHTAQFQISERYPFTFVISHAREHFASTVNNLRLAEVS